jgi:hypothetical protein
MNMIGNYFYLSSIDYTSIRDLIHYVWILKLSDLIIFSLFETKEIKKFNVIMKVNILFK